MFHFLYVINSAFMNVLQLLLIIWSNKRISYLHPVGIYITMYFIYSRFFKESLILYVCVVSWCAAWVKYLHWEMRIYSPVTNVFT